MPEKEHRAWGVTYDNEFERSFWYYLSEKERTALKSMGLSAGSYSRVDEYPDRFAVYCGNSFGGDSVEDLKDVLDSELLKDVKFNQSIPGTRPLKKGVRVVVEKESERMYDLDSVELFYDPKTTPEAELEEPYVVDRRGSEPEYRKMSDY